jgi:hypothetical protein
MNLAWWSEHPSELPLLLLTAVVTHLLMSFSQTLMHYGLGHRRMGGIFFRNHIHFHHVHYSKDHLVSLVYIKNDGDGNNTPFFLIPVALILLTTYLIFSIEVFMFQFITAFASFSAHVYLDNQYHIAGSPLLRFAWFRRKQQLHFVHHKHANSNFAIIDNFWDRLPGTYRKPMRMMLSQTWQFPHQVAGSDGQAGLPRGDTISWPLGRQRSAPSIDMWPDSR